MAIRARTAESAIFGAKALNERAKLSALREKDFAEWFHVRSNAAQL
jgi:hypothetical protein